MLYMKHIRVLCYSISGCCVIHEAYQGAVTLLQHADKYLGAHVQFKVPLSVDMHMPCTNSTLYLVMLWRYISLPKSSQVLAESGGKT